MTFQTNVALGKSSSAAGTSARYLNQRRLYQLFLVITDAVVLLMAFTLAFWLRFTVGIGVSTDVIPDPTAYLRLAFMLVPVWLVIFAAMRLYDFSLLLGGTTEYVRVFNASTWGMMFVIVYSFVDQYFLIARGWLVMSWVLSGVMVSLSRLLMRRAAYRARTVGYFVEPAIIIGTNQEALALAEQLHDQISSGLAVKGFVSTAKGSGKSREGLSILGELEELPGIVQRTGAEEVVVATTAVNGEQLIAISALLAGFPQTKMRLSSGLYEVFTTGMEVTTRNAVPLMSLKRLRLSPTELLLKGVLDYSLVLLALPLLLPLFLLIGLLVRLDSPGPIFYRRRVLGVGGRIFDAFKFRTMFVDGDQILERHPELKAELQRDHKLKYDPRITRVGRLLRRTSLDELPQLINVVLGQMSLVGPRMISPAEHDKYGRMRHNLLTVRPGLTGMWQVSGRSDLSYEDRVRLDMYYIRNYSIWLDIQILFFQTLPAVFKGRGAY